MTWQKRKQVGRRLARPAAWLSSASAALVLLALTLPAAATATADAREPVALNLLAYGAAPASAAPAPLQPDKPALAEAYAWPSWRQGGKVAEASVSVGHAQEVSWSVALDMWRTTELSAPSVFLIGTTPGGGEIVRLEVEEGRLEKTGCFWAEPGTTYYVTLRAGYGYREAAGDIRRFDVFGRVQATLLICATAFPRTT